LRTRVTSHKIASKFQKIVYGWGSTPDPAYDALPDSLLGWGYDKLPTLSRLSLTHFTSSILSLEKKTIFWIT